MHYFQNDFLIFITNILNQIIFLFTLHNSQHKKNYVDFVKAFKLEKKQFQVSTQYNSRLQQFFSVIKVELLNKINQTNFKKQIEIGPKNIPDLCKIGATFGVVFSKQFHLNSNNSKKKKPQPKILNQQNQVNKVLLFKKTFEKLSIKNCLAIKIMNAPIPNNNQQT
eukprot:TRINITY_DN10991_c0_g1_i3.p4 TRINITY_DN10991_c0_g1~~TRINITY_DN10991_c0_g1_i3.p4  ORF type:complete len:166 (+),score=3.86 TRINITY_DN10991_c0_g1_i3:259-756(+)